MDRAEGALRVAEQSLQEARTLRAELIKFSNAKPITSLYLDDDGNLVAVLADGSIRTIGNLRGPPGEDGKDGQSIVGPQGPPGEPGSKGDTGPMGERGLDGIGSPGPKGDPGPSGEQGERGQDGVAGLLGATGAQGLRGERGEQGEKGHDGKDGKDGQKGEQGEKGEKGSQGERGLTGECGEKGEVGKEGPQGKLPIVKMFEPRKVYYAGDCVSCEGATYQAVRDTGQHVSEADWICLAQAGRDGLTPEIRGTFDAKERYASLDIVACDGAAFIAKHDNPGSCPGDGWQLMSRQGRVGKPGRDGAPGMRGEKGEKGERGEAGSAIASFEVDRERYAVKFIMSDGKERVLELRGLYEQYHRESGRE